MDLTRFKDAQSRRDAGFDAALAEIRAGSKRGHWIWYVFPQLDGLGQSAMAKSYAIRDRDEAAAYLEDGVLLARLLAITTAVRDQLARGAALDTLMGSSIDAKKIVSSLTLFGSVGAAMAPADDPPSAADQLTEFVAVAREVLTLAARQGWPACRFTRAAIESSGA